MSDQPHPESQQSLTCYSSARLRQELREQLRPIVRGLPALLAGLAGPAGVSWESRLALQLRLAQLLGCPVCLEVFPRLARRSGVEEEVIAAARGGHLERLPAAAAAVVSWGEALMLAPDARPELVPGAAAALSSRQRAHLAQFVRLERLVHAAGLLLLPHRLIERALAR